MLAHYYTTKMVGGDFIYPYDFVMKLCHVREEEKINSCVKK